MADEQAVVADSASGAEAATAPGGQAAEQADVTHGDAVEQATTPTDAAAGPEATPDPDADDDPETTPSEEDSPEEAKSKAQKRRERRQLRDAERLARERADAVAAYKREQQTEAEAKGRADQAATAARERTERLSQFIGAPDGPDKPGTVSTLAAENAALYERLRTEIGTLNQEQFDEIDTTIKANTARIDRLRENHAMSSEIEAYVWSQLESDFASATAFPELADPALRAEYLNAEGGVRGALIVLADAIRASKDAERDTVLKAQADKHAAEVTALQAEMKTWRIRAGGEEAADTIGGGSPALSGQLLTPARYAAMGWEARLKLRSTPEGRAQIDAMTQRSGAA